MDSGAILVLISFLQNKNKDKWKTDAHGRLGGILACGLSALDQVRDPLSKTVSVGV
jgi:hypothetical protein